MDFDHDPVGTDHDRRLGHRPDQAAPSGRVTGIDHDRQVAHFTDQGNNAQVQSVAGGPFESPDASLAEDDIGIAFSEDIFGRGEKFLDGGTHAALEQDRVTGLANLLEQIEVLHVAGTDLQDIRIAADRFPAVRCA